jgi:tetratricopeptide (TPR) repeat protein
MQARVLANINLFFLDRSMLTTRIQQSLEDSSNDDYGDDTYLCDDAVRINLLMKIYPTLEHGWEKAKAALALGLSATISQDYDLAERLLFECIYMLDTMPSNVPGLKPIVSELGSSALTAFGQVLADNYKYKYSVPAIDGALLLCDMRGRIEDYYSLLRTAARLAQNEGDLPRAIDLYTEIVEHYRAEQRINEAVYVNELLCTMHIENGSFQQAINCLQRASESLPDYTRFFDETAPKNSSFDPGFLRLQLQTAKTLLTSYHWDKSIDLLEQIARYRQPAPLMVATYELLARAFLKKRSFAEADSWLDTWRDYQKEQLSVDGRLFLSRRYSVSAHNANMTYDVAYYALKAKNYFYANKFAEALEFIDKAILFSSATRLASLGKHYFLRGRILRRLCRVAFSMPFPTTLKPAATSGTPTMPQTATAGLSSPRAIDILELPPHVFERPGDLLQECVATYRQAYNYFKLTGDDCKIAKALSDMAEAYLEFLFWPVASSESTFDELSSFPLFKVSMIATNAREEQRQNVINLDRKQTQAQHAASISTHHSSSQSHPTSTAASGTTTPLADSEGESSITKSRVSVDRAKDSSTVSTPGPASANPGSTLQSSGSIMGSTKLGVLTPKGANSHKRSQSAVPATTSVATSVSSSTGLDQSTSSGSPRDVSPDPHSASSGPGSGKLSGDPKVNVVSRSQSRHRSDKMKKKVSMSKVTTIREGTGNGSSSPSGVSITTSNDKISPPPAPLGDKGSGPPSDKGASSDKGVNERLMDKRSTSGVSGKKSDLKESGSKKKGSDIESALGGRGDNDSGDEGDGNDQGNGASLPSFVISLKTIENAAKLALDISSYTGNILMALNGYLNMAEIRYLEGNHEIATSFWIECTEQLSNYFLNGSQFILSDAPPSFLQRMFIMVKRAVRFLFFLPKAVINRNLYMVDLFLALENDLEQQLKKAVGSQVFGTYIGSDASLPRSLFSLKLQKKYRTERTTSVTQLNPPMGSSPSAQSPLAAALAKEEKNLASANSSASLKSELSFGSGSSTSSLSTNSSASSTLGGFGTNSGNGGASGPKPPPNPMAIFNTIDEGGISRSNASLIWGYYFYLRQQQKRYGEGKLTREELKVRYTKSLKVMLKLATVARTQETEYIKEWNKRMTSVMTRKSSRMLLTHTPLRKSAAPASVGANQVSASASTTGIPANPMDTLTKSIDRADRERTDSMAALGGSPMKNPSFEEIITNRNTKLANLVYILQLDDRLVQYVPSSGKRCVQLIGKREQLANSTSPRQVPTHVFMKIHLLDLREDFVTLAIPSDMTLHDVITYLLTRDNWDDEVNPQGVSKDTSDGSKKSSGIGAKTGQFFSALLGGLGSGSSTAAIWPADRIEKVDKSANFYDEFRHLLSWVGDETTPDPTPSISLGGSASDVGGNANSASSPRGKRANSISADRPPSLGRGSISESRPPSLGRSSSISEARPPSLKTILEADSSEGSTKLPGTPSKSPRHQHKGGDVSTPSKLPPGPSTSSAPALDAKIQESQASYLPPIPSGISLSSGLHASRNSDDIAMAGQTSPNSSGGPGSASFGLTTKSPTRPQTVPISLITLAKRKERKSQNSLHAGNLIPLRSKLHKKVYECFSNGELSKNSSTQPLNVFLFISSRNARSGAFNASVSNTIHFSDEVSAYLHGLAGTSVKETSPNLEQILLELAQLFAPLLEILPLSRRPDHPYNLLSADIKTYWKAFCGELDDRSKIPQRVLDAQDTGSGGIVSRCPLSIICSKYMHVIPWELFLPTESVLRYFALEDAAGRHTRMPVKHSTSRKIKKKVNLSFLQCYYSQSFRNIQQQEIIRKSWILQNVNNHLNLTNDRFAADYSGDNSPIFPFHASTVTNPRRIAHYRSKYKHITFIDLWHYVMNPQEIIHIADHVDTPVLILSYADLLEMSTSLLNIVRSKRTPTFVFVPEAHLKEVTIRLGKRHSSAIKQEDANTEDGYQFLMNLVLSVSKELSVPIVVINPPAL